MQPRVTVRSRAMRAGPEGAASRAGVGGGPRPAMLPRAPRGVDWSRSVSWRGSPAGGGEGLGVLSLKEDPEVCQGARVGLNEVWGVVFGMALT